MVCDILITYGGFNMGEITSLPILKLQGTYGEMGVEYGQKTSGLIDKNLDFHLRRFRDLIELSDSDVLKWGEIWREITHDYCSSIAEMLEGLAEGSKHKPAHIFALNAKTEILSSHSKDACTSIAVLPSATKTKHTIMGQNWDWRPEQSEVSLLLATKDVNGFTVLTLAEAGTLAKSGLNSSGIGLNVNQLQSDRDKIRKGVPFHILMRGILQSESMADATRAAVAHDRVSSGNFLIADAEGEAINLETTPDDFGYLLPKNDLIIHSNHFISNVPIFDKGKDSAALTLLRPSRAWHLLRDSIHSKSVTEKGLQAVFRDHYSYPNSICRHVDTRLPIHERSCTVFSTTVNLNNQTFSIAKGQPCEHDYETISLYDLYN